MFRMLPRRVRAWATARESISDRGARRQCMAARGARARRCRGPVMAVSMADSVALARRSGAVRRGIASGRRRVLWK